MSAFRPAALTAAVLCALCTAPYCSWDMRMRPPAVSKRMAHRAQVSSLQLLDNTTAISGSHDGRVRRGARQALTACTPAVGLLWQVAVWPTT